MKWRVRLAGHVALIGEKRDTYNIFVAKPEGKGPLGRPRSRWEDNTRMDLREVGWEGVDWFRIGTNGEPL
jgi:hypothetical protein